VTRVLVSGCSYTQGAIWPQLVYPGAEIINLGRSGAGNTYISDSIVDAIDKYHDIDQVFVLFSAVNRSDIVVPNTPIIRKFLEEYRYGQVLNNQCYIFSGGDKYTKQILRNYKNIKSETWPEIDNIDDYLSLSYDIRKECQEHKIFNFDMYGLTGMLQHVMMLNYLDNKSFLSDKTYLSVKRCIDTLENADIPYQFSFIYNPWNKNLSSQLGILEKHSKLRKQINWDKYVDFTPFEFCLKHQLLADDMFHLSQLGETAWAEKLKKIIEEKKCHHT
jgi:hypothetical protein